MYSLSKVKEINLLLLLLFTKKKNVLTQSSFLAEGSGMGDVWEVYARDMTRFNHMRERTACLELKGAVEKRKRIQ